MIEKEKRAATEAIVATSAHVAQLKLHVNIRQTVMSQVQNFCLEYCILQEEVMATDIPLICR